jgi:hypothetical protein
MGIVMALILLGLVPSMASTGRVLAAGMTFTVNGATGSDPAVVGTCQATPFKTVGAVLACVNQDNTTAASPDTISIAAGTYDEHNLDVNAYVSIQGTAGVTTIDAQQQGRVMTVEPGVTVSIDGLTITNGLGCSSLFCQALGGGIENGGTLTISNSTVSTNTACSGSFCRGAGEGISNFFGTLTISNSTVSTNTACSDGFCRGQGGGISNGATFTFINDSGTVTITNSTLSNNTGCSGIGCDDIGGGISNIFPGTVTITNSTLSTNTACRGSSCTGFGGGIANGATLTITNSTLGGKSSAAGNAACSGSGCVGEGGALDNDSNTPVSLTNDTITFNAAYTSGGHGGGGGIYNKSGTATLRNDTIKNNTPDNCSPPGSVAGCKN